MSSTHKDHIAKYTQLSAELTIRELLDLFANDFPGKVTFSSSFSYEDQAISHIILENKIPISIFTLDTGRLFPETYSVWSATNTKYGARVKAYYPDEEQLQEFVSVMGPNSFYESVETRKACCFIRKVVPLKKALAGNAVWVTGLRAEHSASRHDMPQVEWDEENQVIKYHPLLHWSTQEVKTFIRENAIPFNSLHEKGFVEHWLRAMYKSDKAGRRFQGRKMVVGGE